MMANEGRRANWGHPLDRTDDRLGVSFDPDGPVIGSVALLRKFGGTYVVRPATELNYVLGRAFDQGFDIGRYLPALEGVARAMNAGDQGQAMLRVRLMSLPPLPDRAALERACEAEDLLKASPDDPKHPGYPKGAPDGLGGKFRPKGALAGEEAEKVVEGRLQRLIARRAFRAGVRKILTGRAAARAGLEIASNIDPVGPAEVGDALAAEQAGEMLAQVKEIGQEAQVALDFVRKGPWELEDLYLGKDPESFNSFAAVKKSEVLEDFDLAKRFGDPEPGFEYHHLAEQGANGRTLSPQELNSTTNIVKIPRLLHEEVNAEYSTVRDIDGVRQSLRDSLRGKSFEEHRLAGIEALRRLGIIF